MKNYTKLLTSMTLAIGLGMLMSPSLMAQGASGCAKTKNACKANCPKGGSKAAKNCRSGCMDDFKACKKNLSGKKKK